MKEYKITFTEKELSKLQCFCIMFQDKLLESAETYKNLSLEKENWEFLTLEKFKSNSVWYKETYEVIRNILHKLDEMPF